MFLSVSNWYQSLDRKQYFDDPGDHADEMETSLLLYLKPNLVLPKEKWGDGKEKKRKIKAFSEGWFWSERKWSDISADTGVGNPALATEKKGKKFFIAVTEKIGSLFYDLSKADLEDMYE